MLENLCFPGISLYIEGLYLRSVRVVLALTLTMIELFICCWTAHTEMGVVGITTLLSHLPLFTDKEKFPLPLGKGRV